jgi:drug/metabolite transporter (DMT)-like permease
MNTNAANALWPSVAVASSTLFWGTTWIPLREIVRLGLPQSWSGVLIFAVPALIALPLALYRWHAVRAGGMPLLMTALGVGACNALFAVALTFGEVGMIVLLFYLSPVWATLLERIVIGTPLVRHRILGLALGLAGMVVLQGLGGRLPLPSNLAEWLGLAAGFCWAVALVATNVARESSIVDKTSLQFVAAAAFGLVLVLVLDSGAAWPEPARIGTALPWILGTAVFWIVPAMAFSLWGAARMSPARASMLLMLEVLVALASAHWWAGEPVGLNKLLGGALILSAGVVDAWGSARSDRMTLKEADAA